jgi:hypothetical protein
MQKTYKDELVLRKILGAVCTSLTHSESAIMNLKLDQS